MQPSAAFAEVLDQILDAPAMQSGPAPGAGVPPAVFYGMPTLGFFAFETSRSMAPGGHRAAAARAARAFASFPGEGASPAAEPARVGDSLPSGASIPRPRTAPAHQLSVRQQQALESLRELGAVLEADFNAGELRRAFRELARRYHPDRHPGSAAAERSRLAQLFTQLHDAYLQLQPVVATHTRH